MYDLIKRAKLNNEDAHLKSSMSKVGIIQHSLSTSLSRLTKPEFNFQILINEQSINEQSIGISQTTYILHCMKNYTCLLSKWNWAFEYIRLIR